MTTQEMTTQETAAAIRAHHLELENGLRIRVLDLFEVVRAGRSHQDATMATLRFLDTELLPHAAAEEQALYPAADSGVAALLVRAMREEHVGLVSRVGLLRVAPGAIEAATVASAILALFEAHIWKENELLIPALASDPSVSLGELLNGMHELIGADEHDSGV